MNISEYIAALEAIKAEHGDMNVYTNDSYMAVLPAPKPGVQHLKILNKRESKGRYWLDFYPEESKGEKVCSV